MVLGREVDDRAWTRQLATLEHEHSAELHLTGCARRTVGVVVGGEGASKLQRHALAHDALRVDGVDERVDVGFEQVASEGMMGRAFKFRRFSGGGS
jgi:hypothetical protein